jgi:hypothetical protein
VKLYSTPRKLLRSLQCSYDSDSASHDGQSIAKHSSSSSSDEELAETSQEVPSLHLDNKAVEMKDENETIAMQNSNGRIETLSNKDESGLSAIEAENTSCKASPEIERKEVDVCITGSRGKTRPYRTKFTFLLSMIVVVLAVIAVLIRIDSYDDSVGLVPT